MSSSTLSAVLFITVCAFCTLYIPQPILPLLAAQYSVSLTDSALLISATLIPLGIAPLVYGYVTEATSAQRVLLVSLVALAINQGLFLVVDSYWGLVILRFVQGLLLPAIFTALMTYFASMANVERVRNAVSYYVAASILGGFIGRLSGGLAGQYLHWRWAFAFFAVLLVVCWWLTARLPSDARAESSHIGLHAFRSVLTWPGYLFGYGGLLLVFSTYSSVLTMVPFRLKQLDPSISEVTISLVYVGYLMGIAVALLSTRLRARLRSDVSGILVGTGISLLGLVGLFIPNVAGVFVAMLAMSTGFFLVHAMLSAYLNHAAPHSKGVVNGLYISFYYSGGALGAYLPGFVLRAQGWTSYLLVLCSVFCVGVFCLLGLRHNRA
ncbi:MAG: MFS transporter [Gammaproteobacteria bacterium]|nr:MFS transporter [Gammaproteobacteria bacterium]